MAIRIFFIGIGLLYLFLTNFLTDIGLTRVHYIKGPLVINTWNLIGATETAYTVLTSNPGSSSHLEALEQGLHYCEEEERCGWSVGVGGSPDENGETALDACFVDGDTMVSGSVGNLRRISNGIGVARAITKYTGHTMLVGDLATQFAVEMGFKERDLHSNISIVEWNKWVQNRCQPNFRQNVTPDPTQTCGPYKPSSVISKNSKESGKSNPHVTKRQHDTIGMVVLTASGSIAAGASTNGATWKVPGRLGDGPIIGSAAYADSQIGGCAATGDGDIMMRFLPCLLYVENLRHGDSIQRAADNALLRIARYFPKYVGAIVVLTPSGEFTGSAYGWTVEMAVQNAQMEKPTVYEIHPISEERGSYIVRKN